MFEAFLAFLPARGQLCFLGFFVGVSRTSLPLPVYQGKDGIAWQEIASHDPAALAHISRGNEIAPFKVLI